MNCEQLIVELNSLLVAVGNLPIYIIKTDDGVTFWPEELASCDIKVEGDKIHLC